MTATVVPVPERATANYRSALERTRGVIMAGNLMIHEANCPKLVYALRQPLEDLLRSPVMKALVWVITALEDAKRSTDSAASASDPCRTIRPEGSGNVFRGAREMGIRAITSFFVRIARMTPSPWADPGSSPPSRRMDSCVYLKVPALCPAVVRNLVPRMCRRLIRAGIGPFGRPG